MDRTNKDIELIEKFFDLKLNDAELKSFEFRMDQDEVFARQVHLYQESMNMVQKNDEDMRVRKDRWRKLITESALSQNPSSSQNNWRWFAGLAASIILILSIWQLSTNNNTFNVEASLEKAWKKNVGLDIVVRNNSNDTDKKIVLKALNSYNDGAYQQTLELLQAYDTTFVQYHDILILRALSQHRLENSEIALKTLDTLNSYNSAIARWYKGLIHLSNGDEDQAKNYLVIPKTNEKELQLK